MDLALNNLQRLICHKTKQTKPNLEGDSDINKSLEKRLAEMEIIESRPSKLQHC